MTKRVNDETVISMETGSILWTSSHSYSGPWALCAGEGEGGEDKSTYERALEAWNDPKIVDESAVTPKVEDGATPAKPAEGEKAAEPKPAEPAKPGEPEKPAEPAKPAEAEKGTLDEKAVLEHPKYVELQAKQEGTQKVLDEFKGVLDAQPYQIGSAKELGEVLNDANVLYDIMKGTKQPSELLDMALSNPSWTQAQKDALLLNLADYLAAKGVKKGELDPRDPVHKELLDNRERETKREAAERERQTAETQKKTSETIASKMEDLCKQNGVTDKDDVSDYVLVLGNLVRQEINKELALAKTTDLSKSKILQDLESGKTALVDRLFTEHHNRQLKRQQTWLKGKTDAKDKRAADLPAGGTGAGGAPPPEGAKPYKPGDLADPEKRREAALKSFRNG